MRYFARKNQIETIGNEFCLGLRGEKKSHVREEIKEMLREMERKNPKLFDSIKHGMQVPAIETLFVIPKKENFLLKI
jgi:hypothetical protein